MKIAIVSDAVLPFHRGGKETRIQYLASELVRMGQEVHIYTMKWWDEPQQSLAINGITYHAICRFYPLYSGRRRSFKEAVLFGFACLRMVKYDYDLLEVDHMPYFPLFSSKLVSFIKRRPLYATWHEAVGLRAWQGYIGLFPGTVAYILERLSVHLPDHILAVSKPTYEKLRSELHYKGKLSLVQNGIDVGRIQAAPVSSTTSDIIFTGRLVRHKHVDILLEALNILRSTKPSLRCIIIGDGPERQALQEQINRLNLNDVVTMTGKVERDEDVYSLLKASRIFVTPSTREGFGITILEAYACNLSVVTVNHPDNAGRHLVEPGLGIVCELSAEAIAQAITTLLNAPAHPAIDATRYDWAASAQALKQAYGI